MRFLTYFVLFAKFLQRNTIVHVAQSPNYVIPICFSGLLNNSKTACGCRKNMYICTLLIF